MNPVNQVNIDKLLSDPIEQTIHSFIQLNNIASNPEGGGEVLEPFISPMTHINLHNFRIKKRNEVIKKLKNGSIYSGEV
jgi:hypothetical protein